MKPLSLRQKWVRFLLWFFQQLYYPLAPVYDWFSWLISAGQWRKWQRVALTYLQSGRVLDLGCGTGDLLVDLQKAGCSGVGLDLSAPMLHLARRKLAQANFPSPLCQGRAQQMPFAEQSFDSIVMTFPAPYIHHPATWAELKRTLQSDGRLIIVHGAQLSGLTPWGLLSRLYSRLYQPPTSQPDPIEIRAREAGLTGHWQCISLGRSQVFVFVACRGSG